MKPYCGSHFTPNELKTLRPLIETHADAHCAQLSRQVCALFDGLNRVGRSARGAAARRQDPCVSDPALRRAMQEQVENEHPRTAAALPSCQNEFLTVKIGGLRDCAEVLVVASMAGREQPTIGRRTLHQMDIALIGCALQNMWLAARVEGVGLSWVSFFEPRALGELLALPEGAHPLGILCIGHAPAFYPRPLFEETGRGKRFDLTQVLFESRWPKEGSASTPASY
jgi:5,6-dimethylbenzimidazole synthase